jgi:hypothetical protein
MIVLHMMALLYHHIIIVIGELSQILFVEDALDVDLTKQPAVKNVCVWTGGMESGRKWGSRGVTRYRTRFHGAEFGT